MTLLRKTGFFEDGEDYNTSNNVEINNGVYKRGQLEKKELGSSTKGILHRIFNDFGSMECSDFIDNLQNIVNEYMKTSSYSVGISDLISDSNTQLEITRSSPNRKSRFRRLWSKSI
jgi:DNA-directed RNA polymerase II subunit RPB1